MQRQRERDRGINGKYKEVGVFFLLQEVLGGEALVYLFSFHICIYFSRIVRD